MSIPSGMRADPAAPAVLSRTSDFWELAKPGVTTLVVFTTFAGFVMGSAGRPDLLGMVPTLIGTALAAAGCGALNMYSERTLDSRMRRTALRPLAAGRLSARQALWFASIASITGTACLLAFVHPLAGLLSLVITGSYLFLYTPLKRRTWLCTLVGAVPGALPVLIGWTAVRGGIDREALALFAIVFLWQLPHFYSIGWIHRDEYRGAGVVVLSVVDWGGRRISRQSLCAIAALTALTLLPVFGSSRGFRAAIALIGCAFLGFGIAFARARDRASARRLFGASALYLPLLWILLLSEKIACR